jgi:HK97 family phage major capsid protein
MEKEMKEFLAAVDEKMAAQKAANEAALEAVKKENQKLQDEINQKAEDLAKEGKSLAEIKAEVDGMIAKAGKLGGGDAEPKASFADLEKHFGAAIAENMDAIKNVFKTKGMALEHKVVGDMTTAGNHTGNVAITQFNRPPLLFPQFRHMRSIINVVPSSTLQVDYPREKSPDGEGSFGPQTEGNAKAQMDFDTEMISLTLDYEAAFCTIGRQNLDNVPWVQSYLTRKLSENFYRREDVKTLNFLYSLATSSASAATVVAEAIIDMIAEVDQNGFGSNGILTTPAKWAEILKTKPSDYSVPGGVSFDTNGNVMIGGLPLFKHQNVTAGDIFVGDWNSLYIVQGGSFAIRSSDQHSDNFTKNKVTFLAEAPIGIAFEAPKAIVKKRMS